MDEDIVDDTIPIEQCTKHGYLLMAAGKLTKVINYKIKIKIKTPPTLFT